MNIRNETFRTHDSYLPLIEFVASLMTDPAGLSVVIKDSEYRKAHGGGLAQVLPDRYGRPSYRVTVFTSRGMTYPYYLGHPGLMTVGLVLLHSWEEEFVFLLAHEMRHIEQFLAGVYSPACADDMEIDADKVALWVLKAYRQRGEMQVAA